MTVCRAGVRAVAVALACGVALSLAGCSLGSHSPDAGTAATALPTPTPRVVPPDQVLGHRVGALLAVPAVSVDEDLQTGTTEVEVRLTWSTDGSVVDASSLPIGAHTGAGTEVFRSPGELLERPAGVARSCWSAGGRATDRFDQRVVQEVAVLRSVRATSGDALEITTGWAALARAAGSAKAASGTWLLRFRPFGTTGPRAPGADMMCP